MFISHQLDSRNYPNYLYHHINLEITKKLIKTMLLIIGFKLVIVL